MSRETEAHGMTAHDSRSRARQTSAPSTMRGRGSRLVAVKRFVVWGGALAFGGGMAFVVVSKGVSLGPLVLILTVPVALGCGLLIFAIVRFSKNGMVETHQMLLELRGASASSVAFMAYIQADARRAFRKIAPSHGRITRYSVLTADTGGITVWSRVADRPTSCLTVPAKDVAMISVETDPFSATGGVALYIATSNPATRFSLCVLDESSPRSPRSVNTIVPLEALKDDLARVVEK